MNWGKSSRRKRGKIMFRHTLHMRLLTFLLALTFVGLTLIASQGQLIRAGFISSVSPAAWS